MSLPDVNPKKTVSGIALDPKTLERVIPESRRLDGTTRKQIRIRPGYTPQEDVSKFKSSRQIEMERNALPKGYVPGWVPRPGAQAKPGAATGAGASAGEGPKSRNAAKHAKRKAKRAAEREEKEKDKEKGEPVKENWDDSDGEEANTSVKPEGGKESASQGGETKSEGRSNGDDEVEGLADAVEKLEVH